MFNGKSYFVAIILIISCCFYVGCTDDNDDNPVSPAVEQDTTITEHLQLLLEATVEHYNVPGAAMGVRFPSGEVWIGTTGYANLDTDVEITPSTPFKIGSVTKTFTATVVLQLADEGYFELDDSIQAYIPVEFSSILPRSSVDSVITIRRLLNHTSGLINYVHTEAFSQANGQDPTRVWEPLELVEFATDSLQFDPGTDYTYSNTGYILLGVMIEGFTGTTLKEQIETRIINRLHLGHTWFQHTEIPAGMADGYIDIDGDGILEAGEEVTAASPTAAWAAGAMVSDIGNLLEWLDVLVDGELVSAQAQAARLDDVDVSSHFGGIDVGFGLGIVREGVAWGHVGGIDGFTADINKHADGFDYAALVNGSSPTVQGANVAHNMYEDVIALLLEKGITENITTTSMGVNDYYNGVSARMNNLQYLAR